MDVEGKHRRSGRWLARTAATWGIAVAVAVAAVVPASAEQPVVAPPSGAPQSCDALAPEETTTLAEVREQIGADGLGLTGAGVGVAVIDTGVNAVPGLDGAGKIVDGLDLSFDSQNRALALRDLHGHGTSMAAIAAGKDGVAPGAHVVNVKVGAGDGQTDVSQVIAAVDWVVETRDLHGVRVINLSFDTDATQSYTVDPLSRAVEDAWEAGIVVVVAGGNDGRALGRLGNPARDPFAISVGAAAFDGSAWTVPEWSSRGNGIRNPDVIAPGRAILAAGVPGSYLATNYPSATCHAAAGGLQLRGSGTSQAAAVVAGAAALLLEQRPGLTPDQVKYLLASTADPVGAPEEEQGRGLIDVAAAAAAPTPGAEAVQNHPRSTGLGSLEAARGTAHVRKGGKKLEGEITAFGSQWEPTKWRDAVRRRAPGIDRRELNELRRRAQHLWREARRAGLAPPGANWKDFLKDAWSGATWSGATWSGATWSGATWSGATWSGATWSGATWSGATWSGATWSGATWSGASWS